MINHKCPTCGSNVRIEGETTQFYVPIDKEENEKLKEENARLALELEYMKADAKLAMRIKKNLKHRLKLAESTLEKSSPDDFNYYQKLVAEIEKE